MDMNENGNGFVMPVAPTGYGFGGNGGFGFGGDASWLIILFLFAMMGGWGGMGYGGMGGFGGGMFPWLLASNANSDNLVQGGFNQAATANTLSGIQSAITSGFSNAEVAACNRALTDLERSFAAQTATTGAINGVTSQLANCCCENRLATANLSALVQSENCADREALSNGIRDLIANQTAGTQRIIDQLCADKIDAKNEKIADLERQLTMANLAASQTAQTAKLLADNTRQTATLEDYLNPVARPAYIVQNPNCCTQNFGGCGCGVA